MERNSTASAAHFTLQPERALDKIERCMQSATNVWQLQTTQAFLSLYHRYYGHPLPQREQGLHHQLIQLHQQLLPS